MNAHYHKIPPILSLVVFCHLAWPYLTTRSGDGRAAAAGSSNVAKVERPIPFKADTLARDPFARTDLPDKYAALSKREAAPLQPSLPEPSAPVQSQADAANVPAEAVQPTAAPTNAHVAGISAAGADAARLAVTGTSVTATNTPAPAAPPPPMLTGTMVAGGVRCAIIDGRVYGEGDAIMTSSPAVFRVLKIGADHVVLASASGTIDVSLSDAASPMPRSREEAKAAGAK